MVRLLVTVVLALASPAGVWTQGTPDFTGRWSYDAARSAKVRVGSLNGGGYANWGPAAPVLVITQTPTEITLDRGPNETRWIYNLDGTERIVLDSTNTEPGGPYPFKTRARWDGSRLVLYTRQGLNQQRDVLMIEGSVLHITRDTETPPGSGIDIRLVYSRAAS